MSTSTPASEGREAFTDRLGLPPTATDDEFLAALDTKLARRRSAPAPTPEDVLYESIFGSANAAPSSAEDALYASMFGA